MSAGELHLLQTHPDPRLLAAWMAHHQARHSRAASDIGDALHGLLRAAFGDHAPQPYRYLDERQGLLAYTSLDANAMRECVALADPLAAQALGLTSTANNPGYALRPFPVQWAIGRTLKFEVRTRPTVREGKSERDGITKQARERDVFLQAVERNPGVALNREEIYVQWLRDHLARRDDTTAQPWQGAVEIGDVAMKQFARSLVLRREQRVADETSRRAHAVDGPDVVLVGRLRIIDPQAFAHLIARGVGRHRAFGYGMLLLRPD